MTIEGLSYEIVEFLNQEIHSIRQMETLLYFVSLPDKEFTSAAIAQALGSVDSTTEIWLDEFCQQGFLSKSTNATFRFSPSSPAKRTLVESLNKEYKIRPLKVIDAVINKNTNKMLGFMQAFKLGKKDPNDP